MNAPATVVRTKFRPILDRLANAARLSSSPRFDALGNYTPNDT